jgi:hypothetical protein
MGGGVDIVPLSDGGWVIFYNGGGNVLYMARFASDGQTVSYGPTSVQTGIHSAGNIEAEKLVGGDVVLVYSMNADAPHFKIINPISWTQGSAIQLSDANITTFYYAGVSATSDGGFIAPYWTGLGDVYVNIQHFSASGVPSAYTAQWIHTLTNAYRLGFAGQGPDNVMTIVANYGGGAGGSVQTRYGVGAGSTVLTTIASDGTRNVGIGTSTPAYELDLVGDLNISGAYRVNGTAAATGPHINVDDTPADGDTADAISSNWAFDHDADAAAHHTATVDTNANTICTGDTTYLDGEGNCDDISSVYAPAAPVSRLSAISTKTGDYTMTTTDFIVLIDATSNNVTITLPAVSGNSGLRYKFKRLDNQDPTYTVTIDANSTETIDGAETKTITTQYGTMEIVCDGSAWYIM